MGYQPKVTPTGEQNPPQGVSAIIPYGQAPGDELNKLTEEIRKINKLLDERQAIQPLPEYEEMLVPYPEVKHGQ